MSLENSSYLIGHLVNFQICLINITQKVYIYIATPHELYPYNHLTGFLSFSLSLTKIGRLADWSDQYAQTNLTGQMILSKFKLNFTIGYVTPKKRERKKRKKEVVCWAGHGQVRPNH